ncbi:hypothetical protein B224_5853 [Aeromonas media WS]|nr:hypothetical protein B224_5853 [Aeromonas media WS]
MAGTHRGRPSLVRALGPGKFQVRNFNRLSPVAQGLNSARRRERGRFWHGPWSPGRGGRAGDRGASPMLDTYPVILYAMTQFARVCVARKRT